MSDFFRISRDDFYVFSPVELRGMSREQLAAIIEYYAELWDAEKLRRYAQKIAKRKKMNMIVFIVIIVICTWGAAASAGGSAAGGGAGAGAGGGAAAGGAGGGAAATGGTVAASGTASSVVAPAVAQTGMSAAEIWGMVQGAAEYVGTAATIYGTATGDTDAQRIANAANVVGSGSVTDGLQASANAYAFEQGLELSQDAESQAALRELIEREQAAYADQLALLAAEAEKNPGGVAPADPSAALKERDWLEWVMIGLSAMTIFKGLFR